MFNQTQNYWMVAVLFLVACKGGSRADQLLDSEEGFLYYESTGHVSEEVFLEEVIVEVPTQMACDPYVYLGQSAIRCLGGWYAVGLYKDTIDFTLSDFDPAKTHYVFGTSNAPDDGAFYFADYRDALTNDLSGVYLTDSGSECVVNIKKKGEYYRGDFSCKGLVGRQNRTHTVSIQGQFKFREGEID